MNKEIELGKSLIQLAQIIIIFAGVLFALGGIAYTNAVSSLSIVSNSINLFSIEVMKTNITDLSESKQNLINETFNFNKKHAEIIKPQLDLSLYSLKFGIVLAISSLIIWFFGHRKIKNAKEIYNPTPEEKQIIEKS